jgi:hypothetical protein
MREKIVDYNFIVICSAGKDHLIADALSRNPVFPQNEEQDEEDTTIIQLAKSFQFDPSLDILFEATEIDEDYSSLIDALRHNKPIDKLPQICIYRIPSP